jgi:porphobilinogen synthase
MFPQRRLRRLRRRKLQPLFRETVLAKDDLVAPVFIDETLRNAGIRAVMLFGIPRTKDAAASGAFDPQGIIQQAIRRIKQAVPDMVVITDVCACEYTDHGHCGIIGETRDGRDLLNDPSLELMARIAVSHAKSGADMVAPSCMLDGMVRSIRAALDAAGWADIPIMSYSTKFSSALYGPFREAADSGYEFGDRSTYQMDPSNGREALLESRLDLEEGADVLMVKPAGYYLDVLASVSTLGVPVAGYQVSGEYAMIKAAAAQGWIDEKKVVLESLTSIKRAGADLIITYFAADAARWLDEKQ